MSDRTQLSDDSVKESTTEKQDCILNEPTYNSVDYSVCTKPNVENKSIPVNSAASVFGTHCMNQGSFPKNWTHVKKLREQRQLLHQQLFAKPPDLAKHAGQQNENSKKEPVTERVDVDLLYDMNDFSDTESSDNENLVIAESSSSIANDNPTVSTTNNKQIQSRTTGDYNQGNHESFRKRKLEEDDSPYSCGDSDTENHDCSDLCLMTPSKINDALNVAIASVNDDVSQKEKKNRIRQVLNKLKMKAECHVPCASPESASYTISKPLNNLHSTTNVYLANDKYVISKGANVESPQDTNQSSDVVKYFGLPYTSTSKPTTTHTDVTHNGPRKQWTLNKDLPQTIDISAEIPSEVGDCGSTKGDVCDDEEPIDYTNIAFQKLMAERRLQMSSKSDKLQDGGNKNEEPSQDCPQDLKMIRTKSESGTNSIKIEEVVKDKSENENNVNIIGLLNRIKEVNIAKQMMLKAQLDVLHQEKHLMEVKRRCLELGAAPDDVSLSPSPPSSPVHIDVEHYDETEPSNDHTFNIQTRLEEAKKKLNTNNGKHSNVSSEQYGNPRPKQNIVIKSTLQTDANKNEIESVKAAKNTRKSKRIVENKGQLNSKGCMCSSMEMKASRNIPVSENPTKQDQQLSNIGTVHEKSTSMAQTTNCIVSSQSLLRKHLTLKDKDSSFATTNNHVLEARAPSSAVCDNTVKTAGKPVLYSSNGSLKNVDKGHPQILNVTVPSDVMKSSTKLPDMPALVSHKNNTSDSVKTVVMPIGCVKDEGTNQVYPTYHYNGFTFALINNKMYHIRMNSSPTNPGTNVGTSLPTNPGTNVGHSLPFPASSATIVMPAKPKLVPVTDPINVTRSLVNIKPRVDVKAMTNTSSAIQLVTSGSSVSYRLPVNIVNSTSSSQPVNLVLVPAKTEGNVGLHPQILGGQAVVVAKATNANFIIGTNSVKGILPKIIPTKEIHPIPGPIPTVSVGSSVVASHGNVQPVLRLANHQIHSANSSALQSKSVDKASVKVIPSNQPLKSQTGKTRDKTQIKQEDRDQSDRIIAEISKNRLLLPHKVSSSESQSGTGTRHKGGATIRKSLSSETLTNDINKSRLNEQISRKRRRNKQKHTESRESVENVVTGKPVEDIDEAVSKHKRKRKGTPPKKIHRKVEICDANSPQTNQVEEPRQLLDEWMSEQEEFKKKSEASDGDVTTDRGAETPVPFVNYPARIVCKPSGIDGSKVVSIVGSPNYVKPRNTTCSGSDTSLNEEKMVKMLQFADEFELEQKKKGESMVRKRSKFKRRKNIDSTKCATTDQDAESESTDDSDAKIPKSSVADCEKMLVDYSQTATDTTSYMTEAKLAVSSPCDALSTNQINISNAVKGSEQVQQSPTEQTEGGRNVFEDLEATVTKHCEYSDKDTEVEDQYDSSDFENYENFLLSKAKNSLKRKSQLIESYYTAEGLHERHSSNSKAVSKVSNDELDVFSTSDKVQCIPCAAENGRAKTNNSLSASVEISYSSIVSPKENVDGAYSVAGASTAYTSVHPDKINNLLPDYNAIYDKAVKEHSRIKCDIRLKDQSRNVVMPQTIGTPHDSATATCNTGVKKGCLRLHTVNGSDSHSTGNSHSGVSSPNKCPSYVEKRFTKTKLIILKGEMCDRWMKIKKQTGFGEMSDPQFVQYLLRLEEERQCRMKRMLSELTDEDPLYYEDTGLSKEFSKALTSTPVCTTNENMEPFSSSPVSSVVDLNNNNCCQSPVHEVDAMLDCSDDDDDDEDTIIDIVNMSTDSCTLSQDHTAVDCPTQNTANHGIDQINLSCQRKPVPEETNVSPYMTGVPKKRPVKMIGTSEVGTSPPSKKQATRSSCNR